MNEIKKYYLLEKGESIAYIPQTIDEIKYYFEPNKEVATEEELKSYGEISDADSLTDFIESYVNNCQGEHYHDYYIKEV